jgi:hypothetical protein
MNKLLDLLDKLPGPVAALAVLVWLAGENWGTDNELILHAAIAWADTMDADLYNKFSFVRAVAYQNPDLPFGEEVFALLDELEDEL